MNIFKTNIYACVYMRTCMFPIYLLNYQSYINTSYNVFILKRERERERERERGRSLNMVSRVKQVQLIAKLCPILFVLEVAV